MEDRTQECKTEQTNRAKLACDDHFFTAQVGRLNIAWACANTCATPQYNLTRESSSSEVVSKALSNPVEAAALTPTATPH